MRKSIVKAMSIATTVAAALVLPAQQQAPATSPAPKLDVSLVKESKAAIQRAVNYLTDQQAKDGSWLKSPPVTGLAIMALAKSNAQANAAIREDAIKKGREFILKHVQPSGAIYPKEEKDQYPNYSTAICLCALATLNKPEDETVMRNARKYLMTSQVNENFTVDGKPAPVNKDNPNFGGIGYGKEGPGNPDLSNTQWALEALYMTDFLDSDTKAAGKDDKKKADMAWENAVIFLSRCQNVPESNDQTWVVKDKNDPNYGGFVYKTDDSKAGKDDKNQTLRSYGSMTYAGLKSMLYAKLGKDDPRIKAAIEWASKNYTLDENPGMKAQGHYYYIHTFTKALAVLGEDTLTTADGKKQFWRADVIRKLLSLQRQNGEWFNEEGRWMESIPALTTTYALMAMELALGPELYSK